MKRFIGFAGLGLVALLVAAPGPAAAAGMRIPSMGGMRMPSLSGLSGIGRIGSIGGMSLNIGRPLALLTGRVSLPSYWPRVAVRDRYYVVDPGYATQTYSFYGPVETVDASTATIRMHVPVGAVVLFDGNVTAQTGSDRTFVSPSLAPGSAYVYQIRVQWSQNGQVLERNHDVTLHAGDVINLTIDR